MNDQAALFIAQAEPRWKQFCVRNQLTVEQQEKFASFGGMLLTWNAIHNLTAITDAQTVVADHFQDSLSIMDVIDVGLFRGSADVGTGGGFPGIPLKIMYPELPMVLIEVNAKKVAFLQEVITSLGLKNIEVCDVDWRTFVRKTTYDIDIFFARASLRPDELTRIFSGVSHYQQARMVYWASRHWKLEDSDKKFFDSDVSYHIDGKIRKLVFFAKVRKS